MINIPTAREVASNRASIRDEGIDYCLGYIVKAIERANNEGRRRTCFTPRSYGYTDEQGNHKWLDLEDELRQILKSKGYTFRPTGYIGGVWQRTEDICW